MATDLSTATSARVLAGDERIVLGACAAVAARIDVDPLVVRLAAIVLTVAAGIGIPLYALAWLLLVWQRPASVSKSEFRAGPLGTFAVAVVVTGVIMIVDARTRGVPVALVGPAGIVALGIALAWPRVEARDAAANARSGLTRIVGGLVLVAGGLGTLLAANISYRVVRDGLASAAFVVAGTLLLFAPWLFRLLQSLGEERRQRIRADERAEVAAHLHDSVLQTLTLIQKRAGDPAAMAALARRQERELRHWLYAPASNGSTTVTTWRGAMEAIVAEIEDQHLVAVDTVLVGDRAVDAAHEAAIAATREALVNAAKFAGTNTVSLFAQVTSDATQIFVRDRGTGFVLDAVPADRHGIRDSIVGRVERAGGTAVIRTTPGEGTEVRLRFGPQPS